MESTLLDNLQLCPGNNYWNLYDGCTIVLAPYITTPISMWQEYQAPELVAATPPEKALDAISREFKDFTFQAKGTPLKKSDIMSTSCSGEPLEFSAEASGNHDLSTGATIQALPTLQERHTTTEWFTDSDRATNHGEFSEHMPEGVVLLPISGNVESGGKKSLLYHLQRAHVANVIYKSTIRRENGRRILTTVPKYRRRRDAQPFDLQRLSPKL